MNSAYLPNFLQGCRLNRFDKSELNWILNDAPASNGLRFAIMYLEMACELEMMYSQILHDISHGMRKEEIIKDFGGIAELVDEVLSYLLDGHRVMYDYERGCPALKKGKCLIEEHPRRG